MINAMVEDVVAEAGRRLAALAPRSADEVRAAAEPVVAFSRPMIEANLAVRDFLFRRMYRHWRVNRAAQKSKRVSQLLFQLLHGGPQMLPHALGASGQGRRAPPSARRWSATTSPA